MPNRQSPTAVNRSATLTCAVEPALAEIVRKLAGHERRSISFMMGELLREAVARREQTTTLLPETTNASA